jgi:GLPGLI family protein
LKAGAGSSDLTVSWSISVTSGRGGDMGLAETYNGGVETLFATDGQARIRLVSLMRIQSILMSAAADQAKSFIVVKESGKDKYVTRLTEEEWKKYNKKYAGAVCKLTEDTSEVLHFSCKKAIVTLKNGRVITAWYTSAIRAPAFSSLEPAFSAVPGLVLKYEYTYKRKTIIYTATSISHAPIERTVFKAPAGGGA